MKKVMKECDSYPDNRKYINIFINCFIFIKYTVMLKKKEVNK